MVVILKNIVTLPMRMCSEAHLTNKNILKLQCYED